MFKKLFKVLSVLTALYISFPVLAEEVPQTQVTELVSVSIPVIQPLPQQTESARIKRGELCPPVPSPTDPWPAQVASLVGGCQSTSEQQHYNAQKGQLRFMFTPAERQHAFDSGYFVPLDGPDVNLKKMQGPYVLPITASFVHVMASRYRTNGCGRLAVNSGVRAISAQPGNASAFSLHPTGLAVDLAIPMEARCEVWLENYLREQEEQGLVDATRELNPPHFHVVMVPKESNTAVQLAAHNLETPAQ